MGLQFKVIKKFLLFVIFLVLVSSVHASSVYLAPNGQKVTQWLMHYTCSENYNYQCVDDILFGDGQAIYSSSSASTLEIHHYSDVPAGTIDSNDVINFVQAHYRSLGSSFTRSWCFYSVLSRFSGFFHQTYDHPFVLCTPYGTGDVYFTVAYYFNPFTGNPWTVNDINSLAMGMRSALGSDSTYTFVMESSFLSVNYTPQ